jgi:preprotein translocase subunit SecF
MQLFKLNRKIDFLGKRKIALALSGILILISLGSLVVRGLNFGIDFTGGTLIEVAYPSSVDLEPIRESLQQGGFGNAQVQHFGRASEVLVRLPPLSEESKAEISTEILELLNASGVGRGEMLRVEFVGPQVGEELREDGGLAMLFALIAIFGYIMLRFEWRFSLGAVAALAHDVMITLGVFSVVQIEFDLTVLAALLAVIGYSLNDTIVVFDRIRENFRKIRKGTPVEIMNTSINQTISRTLMTSFTTLIVLFALFFLGGEIIYSFALALIIGVVVGTYSSIYIASTTALALGVSRVDLLPPEKEGAKVDDRP